MPRLCRTLVKFVNNNAELPSREVCLSISCDNNDSHVLNEIGKKLHATVGKLSKTPCVLRVKGKLIIADIVDRGKLCVASCDDKLCVLNIIMSLYANHGSFPEPWQVLICKKSTMIEEHNIFIKRCFFAAKNGYKEKLFCITNLELLEFELQLDLVESIRSMREKYNDYFLPLVCCRESSFHHHILDQFSQDVHSTNGLNAETMKTIYRDLYNNVVCVSSDLSRQGKTEWIKQATDNPNESNMFLFELLSLGFVSSNVDVVSFPQNPVFIEVSSTFQQKLLNSLPITGYLIKEHLSWDIDRLNISIELYSPIQIVCNYLDAYEMHELDVKDIVLHGQLKPIQ
ncbi:e3 ubiquitin-protein ligase [Gigaspora margarita]|uniref:E3 ubiquitin-protein ligase n=1 Tax=Gigaspora margarita TaxID=4874 RepID=A0A8H4ETZ7_GIGMA|nr:e3 ubiquitin-protein ligase [Gigaspora margarita]